MLTQLTITNFALIRELAIDFQRGMTVITGETGAGKSIAIDALGLCLGERAEGMMVRPGASRADLCVRFQLTIDSPAHQWLVNNQLDDGNECLLRRAINIDGRSRGFINGTPVPLSQLRELGHLLVQIHGQHAHQSLLKIDYQRTLLDAYLDDVQLINATQHHFQAWHTSKQQLTQYQLHVQSVQSRRELLDYQLKELDAFSPQPDEFQQIECEYKRLTHRGQLLSTLQQTLTMLDGDETHTVLSQLSSLQQMLSALLTVDSALTNVCDLLNSAAIQLGEASNELCHYQDKIEVNPTAIDELEQRHSLYITLARKHHVAPEALAELHQQLQVEAEKLVQQEHDQHQLRAQVSLHWQQALACAQQLHQRRRQDAQKMAAQITQHLHTLALPHAEFAINIAFNAEALTVNGGDSVEFLVRTNPGQPLQPISKVASGGELSRIALAIQVITAQKMALPAMIFDEVDSGISGATATAVGNMLRQLAASAQVMCVTHLPQVAGCGHHHLLVSKQTDGSVTETAISSLNKHERIQELARLLGGNAITRHTLANAKELLVA